jgi:DNA sulfur modification protein DndB
MSKLISGMLRGDDIAAALKLRSSTYDFEDIEPALLDSRVAEAWQVEKTLKRRIRLSRAKPPDRAFEDRVWTLFAKMGFLEMSDGRNCTISTNRNLNGRQIDVFCVDQEVALLVECTQAVQLAKRSPSQLIEKICSIRKPVHDSITKHYDRKLKSRWIVATNNIAWGEADLAKARENKLVVLREEDIEYFEQLVKHLGHAARYQMLAQFFQGEDIHELGMVIPAIKCKTGKVTFYNFLLSPDELLKISYVGHKNARNKEALESYQRILQSKRLRKIASYVNEGGQFPTNIVINAKVRGGLKFERKQAFKDAELGELTLPHQYASAWIIDGQHRLYGYAQSARFKTAVVPVLAFENLSAEKQAQMFVDINHEQVRVSRSHLVDLLGDLNWDSTDEAELLIALSSRIVKQLSQSSSSPIANRVVFHGKDKSATRCLTVTSLADGLRANKLLGVVNKGTFIPGPLWKRDKVESLRKSTQLLEMLFATLASRLPVQWALGDAPRGYICTNNAVNAVFRVLRSVCEHIESTRKLRNEVRDAEDLYADVVPMLEPALVYLENCSDTQVQALRDLVGVKGQTMQAFALMEQIHRHFPTFKPDGLDEYMRSKTDIVVAEARELVFSIQVVVSDFVMRKLREHFSSPNQDWWRDGVPLKIRQTCAVRREEDSTLRDPEKYLDLIDYYSIMNDHWQAIFRHHMTWGDPNARIADKLSWVKRLNEIRKTAAHPERGMLSDDDLAFLRKLAGHVEGWKRA